MLDGSDVVRMIQAVSAAVAAARDDLNALDSSLGDGDHGTSLSEAFADAAEQAAALSDVTPSAAFHVTAKSLMNRMGGASGALYGTLFLRASLSVQGKEVLSHADWVALWRAALEGVMQRGKAQPGEKTMIDALHPAVEALAAAHSFDEAFAAAARAAAQGAQQTAQMVARHGRAKFVGERAIGHEDAGARSIALMFEALNEYWKAKARGEA